MCVCVYVCVCVCVCMYDIVCVYVCPPLLPKPRTLNHKPGCMTCYTIILHHHKTCHIIVWSPHWCTNLLNIICLRTGVSVLHANHGPRNAAMQMGICHIIICTYVTSSSVYAQACQFFTLIMGLASLVGCDAPDDTCRCYIYKRPLLLLVYRPLLPLV